MLKKIITIFAIAVSLTTLSAIAKAESPCTYRSHDNLQMMMVCATGGRINSPYMNGHHVQMMSAVANHQLPAQQYPYVGNDVFYSHYAMGAALGNSGRRWGSTYPVFWNAYPYGTNAEDIVTIIQNP